MSLVSPPNRLGIVYDPHWWMGSAGFEFWAMFYHNDTITTASNAAQALAAYGWITSGATVTELQNGDFISSADIDPPRIVVTANAFGSSPRIFGSYAHALQASRFLGYMPTKLCLEIYAVWTVATANENGTFFGFTAPSVTDVTAAGSVAGIMCDGSNFRLKSDNGDDAGAADDGSFHLFRIEVGATNTEWFIDNVSQGTIATEADIWPTSFRYHSVTGSTNRFQIVWLRVYYK